MNKIYITSDLHFGHDKPFIYEPRGFSTIEEMNEQIIENWNSIIDDEDDVYVLGDLMLGDNAAGLDYIRKLRGRLHIVLGNHDTDARIKEYYDLHNVVSIEYGDRLKYKKYHFYLSHYPTLTANFDEDKPLKRRVINLCGHSHYKNKFQDMNKGLIYHVELDAHNCYPVDIETIIEDIKRYIKEQI